jgi:hypothetical protein
MLDDLSPTKEARTKLMQDLLCPAALPSFQPRSEHLPLHHLCRQEQPFIETHGTGDQPRVTTLYHVRTMGLPTILSPIPNRKDKYLFNMMNQLFPQYLHSIVFGPHFNRPPDPTLQASTLALHTHNDKPTWLTTIECATLALLTIALVASIILRLSSVYKARQNGSIKLDTRTADHADITRKEALSATLLEKMDHGLGDDGEALDVAAFWRSVCPTTTLCFPTDQTGATAQGYHCHYCRVDLCPANSSTCPLCRSLHHIGHYEACYRDSCMLLPLTTHPFLRLHVDRSSASAAHPSFVLGLDAPSAPLLLCHLGACARHWVHRYHALDHAICLGSLHRTRHRLWYH